MPLQTVVSVLENLFAKLRVAVQPEASQMVQFEAGELHRLKMAYDALIAQPIAPAPAPMSHEGPLDPAVYADRPAEAGETDEVAEAGETGETNAPTGT